MTKKIIVLLCLLPLTVAAGTVQLLQTGEKACYNSSGTEISCAGTGQDGDLRAGIAWSVTRFTDNSNGTVTDTVTGLMWSKDANLMTSRNPEFDNDSQTSEVYPLYTSFAGDGSVTWQHALDYIKKLNSESYLGFNDWRLPNVNEIKSLIDLGNPYVSMPAGVPFTNVQVSYWSSTTVAKSPTNAWHGIGLGNVFDANGSKTFNNYVWPVRGTSVLPKTGQTTCYDTLGSVTSCAGTGQDGQLQNGVAWPSPRFTDNLNSTVTDNLTQLIWAKSAATPGPVSCSPNSKKTWQGALDHVACLNSSLYLGYGDWRLPNREELLSLVDRQRFDPALPQGNPFSSVPVDFYWTSSSYSGGTGISHIAWNVIMDSGYVGYYGLKTDQNYVWPVRGGQMLLAGNGTAGFSGDGASADLAMLNAPWGVALDRFGNTYITTLGDNRIRKIDNVGIITTVAGNGTAGFSGDGGSAVAASLNHPASIAVDSNGNIFIPDTYNHRIRKVNAAGIITTVAGNGVAGFSGDGGPATSAMISSPWGVALDGSGNLFIADTGGNRVRKVSPGGTITTVAGNGSEGFSGDGGPATNASLFNPWGVAVDQSGNLYIADANNQRLRKVNTSGIISTIAGNGTAGTSGDGGLATLATVCNPGDIAIDTSGIIYVGGCDRVRKISLDGIISGVMTYDEYLAGGAFDLDALGYLYQADQVGNRVSKIYIGTSEAGDSGSGGSGGSGGGATQVPVMGGWWLLPGVLAGLGMLVRRGKE